MTICSTIHNLAMQHGGGSTVFKCPITGAQITGFIGPGGVFSPTSIDPVNLKQVPTLDQGIGRPVAAFANARGKKPC